MKWPNDRTCDGDHLYQRSSFERDMCRQPAVWLKRHRSGPKQRKAISYSKQPRLTPSFRTRKFSPCSPRTKEIASIKFDLPEPFGPTTAVNLLKGPMMWTPLNDLKSSISNDSNMLCTICWQRCRIVALELAWNLNVWYPPLCHAKHGNNKQLRTLCVKSAARNCMQQEWHPPCSGQTALEYSEKSLSRFKQPRI